MEKINTSWTYLVFGDLHGRVLPAFRLASAWARDHKETVAGLLQVGDLGFFPDPTRLDKATRRHAAADPMELGTQLVTEPNKQADAVFAEETVADGLWFTQGNHEDFEALALLTHGAGSGPDDFPVDAYRRVFCIRDGHVTVLPGGLRVAALWGVQSRAADAQRMDRFPGRIRDRSAWELTLSSFDVLLTHDAPRGFVYPAAGSNMIRLVIEEARPSFAFFGHYHPSELVIGRIGSTQVAHLHGLELRGPDGTAEEGSVGVLRWSGTAGTFEFVDARWLKSFTRHNWMYR
jgi:hypothetical protein